MDNAVPDPSGFEVRLQQFVEWVKVRNQSPQTITRRIADVRSFARWCEERGVLRPVEVSRAVMERYQRHLFYKISERSGRPIGVNYQLSLLTSLRSFFRWMLRHYLIAHNPAADLDLPKADLKLPRAYLSDAEARQVLLQPDIDRPLGLRDRSILETLYATGIRRMELAYLSTTDINFEKGVLFVRRGKGRKERVVPIGDNALFWVRRWLESGRPRLLVPPDEGRLFLTIRGKPMSENAVTHMAEKYITQSGIGKKGCAHLFRHTCATAMLEGGADTRYVQAMLGHSSLEATQIYTHVAITKLKEVYALTHPAAKLKSRSGAEQKLPDEDDVDREGWERI